MKNNIGALYKQFHRYTPLLKELIVRDLKLKYRRSFLGYLWSLLNPLLMMIVMSLVFSYMFRFEIPNYPLYLICGQTLWAFFNESTSLAMHSVIGNGALIRKVYIPKYIFPLSRVLSSFVTMSFSLAAIFIVMIFTGVSFCFEQLLIPIPLALLFTFCIGVGMALSAMAVYFRDIIHLYGVLTMAWMYLTPIFYPISSLPIEIAGLIQLNPMFHYVDFFRSLILHGTVPELNIWCGCFFSSVISLMFGLWVFKKLQKNFILNV